MTRLSPLLRWSVLYGEARKPEFYWGPLRAAWNAARLVPSTGALMFHADFAIALCNRYGYPQPRHGEFIGAPGRFYDQATGTWSDIRGGPHA